VVAESMPAGLVRALAELDIDGLVSDVHHHHHETPLIEKALGTAECRPGDAEDDHALAETIHVGHWDLVDEADVPGGDHAADDCGVDVDISGVAWGGAVE
jgi:hypothetical protein